MDHWLLVTAEHTVFYHPENPFVLNILCERMFAQKKKKKKKKPCVREYGENNVFVIDGLNVID